MRVCVRLCAAMGRALQSARLRGAFAMRVLRCRRPSGPQACLDFAVGMAMRASSLPCALRHCRFVIAMRAPDSENMHLSLLSQGCKACLLGD
jgi:hypothetical protein